MPNYWGKRMGDSWKWVKSRRQREKKKKEKKREKDRTMVITMAHAKTHGARKPLGPIQFIVKPSLGLPSTMPL